MSTAAANDGDGGEDKVTGGVAGDASNELVKNCSSGIVIETFLVGDLDRLANVL